MSPMAIVLCSLGTFILPLLRRCDHGGVCWIEELISFVNLCLVGWRTGDTVLQNFGWVISQVRALSHCRHLNLGEVSLSSADNRLPRILRWKILPSFLRYHLMWDI